MRRGYGKPPKLYRWQVAYLKRAAKLRQQLTNAALAKKFGIGESTVQAYINDWGLHGCREDYDATIAASKRREGVLLPKRATVSQQPAGLPKAGAVSGSLPSRHF